MEGSPERRAREPDRAGEVDFIAATYSITDARKEKVSFAGPYLLAHQDLLVTCRRHRHHQGRRTSTARSSAR